MHAVSISGEILFQIEVGENVNSSTSFVDLGGVAYAFFGADDGFVYAVDTNGDPLNGWPKDLGGGVNISTSVSFSDLDGDGVPETHVRLSGGQPSRTCSVCTARGREDRRIGPRKAEAVAAAAGWEVGLRADADASKYSGASREGLMCRRRHGNGISDCGWQEQGRSLLLFREE